MINRFFNGGANRLSTNLLTEATIAILALAFVLLCFACTANAEIDSDMDIISQSVASVNDISAGFVNPAGLGLGWVMALRYIHAFPDSTLKGDDGLMLATRGNMISIQWLYHTNDVFRRKFLLAAGKRMFPDFYWGLSFAYFTGNEMYKKKQVWKLGIIYKPINDVSFGMVIDDLNEPSFSGYRVNRLYTVGASVRVKQVKGEFSADAWLRENDSFNKLEAKFRVQFVPLKEISIVAHYITEGEIQLGLIYNLPNISIGAGLNYLEDDFRGGNFYYNQLPRTSHR
jgi:hypothetical protein